MSPEAAKAPQKAKKTKKRGWPKGKKRGKKKGRVPVKKVTNKRGWPKGKKRGRKPGSPRKKITRASGSAIGLDVNSNANLKYWSDFVIFLNKNKGKTFIVQTDGINYTLNVS